MNEETKNKRVRLGEMRLDANSKQTGTPEFLPGTTLEEHQALFSLVCDCGYSRGPSNAVFAKRIENNMRKFHTESIVKFLNEMKSLCDEIGE